MYAPFFQLRFGARRIPEEGLEDEQEYVLH